MHGFIQLAVVRFLEHLERAYADGAEHLEICNGKRRGIYVDAADSDRRASTRRLDLVGVACLDCLRDVFCRSRRMFTINSDKTLMADAACKDVYFLLQLVHRQDAALLFSIPFAEAAVPASVHA